MKLATFLAVSLATLAVNAMAYQPPDPVSTNTVRAAPNGDQITTRSGIERREFNFPHGRSEHLIEVREVKSVDQGAGCTSIEAVTAAHAVPLIMLEYMKTGVCFRIDPGEVHDVTYARPVNDLVEVVSPSGVIIYTPSYIFGDNLKY